MLTLGFGYHEDTEFTCLLKKPQQLITLIADFNCMTTQMLSCSQLNYRMLQKKCAPHVQGSEYNNQCTIYMKIVVTKPD